MQYSVSAVRLTNTPSNKILTPTPYIMIRTAKGVTVEGIDGLEYLKQGSTPMPLSDESST
jgi:hypothetical protein